MERLTTNKSVDDMSMVELAHNSCYVDDEGNARYRDYEMEMDALEEVQKYRAIGTPEEFRAAVEKQTAISRELIEGKYFCPKCHNLMPYPGYCGCGQKVY